MGEQHVNKKILDESKLRFLRLTNALLRIDKPMFGICIECEEPIGIRRMSIRPESVRCVECANQIAIFIITALSILSLQPAADHLLYL